MRKNRGMRLALLRRICAFALILVLSLSLLPGLALAAGGEAGTDWKTLDNSGNRASSGKAMENTYIFEVSCGTRRGGDSADNVLYFIISYKTVDGQKRTTVLAPHEDAISKGFKMAEEQGNRNDRQDRIIKTFACSVQDLDKKEALVSLATDQYMFTTPEAILSIDQIQIFGKHNEEHGDWSCQGMRIYKVDTLYGLEMVGWYSDQGYIDFDGKVICQVEMPAGGVTFKWTAKSGMYTLNSKSAKGKVVNCDGPEHSSQLGTRVVFRIDLADTAGAGFEAMAGNYDAGGKTKISDLKYCETAAMTVRYTDIFGCVREFTFPVMINALGQIMEVLGDAYIAEFAQQGDSLAIPLMLPDFASLDSVNIVIGSEKAVKVTNLMVWAGGVGDGIRLSRITGSETDDISYLCFAAYREVTAQVALEGATLRTRFISGSPIQVSTATSPDGVNLQADKSIKLALRKYETDMPLAPKDRTERYLVTMSTDNVPNAGTTADIYLQFTYISMQGKELQSSEYRVRDYVREFYGEWPGNTGDFAYNYGLRDGGTVQFLLPLQGVQEFKKVSVRLSGEDEWQFTGIELAFVKPSDTKTGERSISPRLADWEEIAVTGLNNHPQGLYSNLRYTRQVDTDPPCFTVGTVYEEGEDRPDPNKQDQEGEDPEDPEDKWEPGTLVQDDGEDYIFDGETQEVTKKDDVPWDQLRHYMTFADAQQDLGFTKERCVYTVSVQVAGKTVNAGNDDCGSKNLFYFRLIFENGNSGCTLANQQIVGDAFGTGDLVQFKIRTSQDYGEVVAIQVIPDSQDSNSDIYDKLQIEEISVTRDTVSAVSPTWTAKIATSENEGWVGIDYRDPGEAAGTSNTEGRTLQELATTFPITETSYSTNLLVSITTASYETGVQFSGGIRMDLNFINAEGRTDPKPVAGFDVVAAMNSYGGLTGSQQRKYRIGDETKVEEASYYVSDSRYQFLPGSVDSFLVTIKNVNRLTDMTLTVYSDVVTDWTIKDVNVYQLNGQGIRYLNPSGSYAYRYKSGQEPTLVARWDLDRLTTPLVVYDAVHNTSMAPISFALDSETIKLSEDAAKWSSKISREPNSHNDSVNLIFYPAVGSGAADPADYDVTAAVKYTDLMTMQTLQVSTGQMRRGTDAAGNTVFYATGLSTSNLNAILGVDWSATILRSAQPTIPNGVLQVVRGGVLIDSYPLSGVGNSLRTSVGTTAVSTQRLLLQVSDTTKKQAVKANENDLAVALYFRSDYPGAQELRSKYVFLSDMGIEEVRPGQLLELDYNLGNVGELTGISLVSMGKLDLTVDSVYLADQAPDGSVNSQQSYRSSITPSVTPARYNFDGEAKLLNLTVVTASDESTAYSGTDGPVSMVLGYYDIYGELRTLTYKDVRHYIVSGDRFSADSTDTIRMLIPDMAELRWVELEPKSENADGETAGGGSTAMASWKVRQISASLGMEDRGVTRVLDQRIVEGAPLHVVFSDIVLLGTVYVAEAGGDLSQPVAAVTTGNSETITVDSGADVFITMRVSGSDDGFTAKLNGLDPVTDEVERALLDPTHGYSEETLDLICSSANASLENAIYEQERENAQKVLDLVQAVRNSAGRFYADQIRLTTPHNYTGSRMKYRITVSSVEEPDAYFTLDVIVRSEPNQLADAIEAWDGVRTAGTIYLRAAEDGSEEKIAVLEGETLSQLLDSGSGITIVPHMGVGEEFEAVIREMDPVTNATGQAKLGATHGYSDEDLDALRREAQESLRMDGATDAERQAARTVIAAIDEIRDTEGSFETVEGEVRFTTPHNYTGSVLYYRITVASAQTGDTAFTVDVSVKSEPDPLTGAVAAWRAVQTVGSVSVLNERGRVTDTVRLMKGDTHAQLLASGQGLLVEPRVSGGFEAAVKSFDPVTGATGTANLEASTGYTTDELSALRAEARTAMSDDNATDAETRAAEAVIRAIDSIRNTDGDYDIDDEEIEFTAPHNYTGSALYYRIIVTETRTGETLFTVDLSVESEENPLTSALEAWRAVQTAGTVKVLDSGGKTTQDYSLSAGETHAQRLESGGGLVILPRGDFTAEISSLDPTIGATSAADLNSIPGSSSKDLQWMEELAREVISEEEDDAVVAAARRLLSAIDEVQDSKGAFRITDEQIRFTAPRNFSGSTVYYRITVESDETGEVLFTLDISVSSERDPVTEAFNDLNDAITNAQKNKPTDDADADEEEDQNG